MSQSIRASFQRSTGRRRPDSLRPPGRTNTSAAPRIAATPSGRRACSQATSGCFCPSRPRRTPGTTHSPTVTVNAATVDHCATVQAPSRARSAATCRETPASRSTPAGNNRPSSSTANVPSTPTTGRLRAHQPGNEIATPSSLRMKPRPMRFVGVPIGVASPPIEAAKAMHR